MGADAQALAEFDVAYPGFVTLAHRAVQRFFRYDPTEVEDAVAETMARTYERWERVRRHENPNGWVVLCAKNVCLEQLRAKTRNTPAVRLSRDDLPPYIDHAEHTVISTTIWETLAQLSKRQRDVAVLRYLMDCDEVTTAAALGTTPSKVKTAAHEARGRLKSLLAGLYADAGDIPA